MRILPFLVLVSICTAPLTLAQGCRLDFPKVVQCHNDDTCLTFESKYNFAKNWAYCKGAEHGNGICCFNETVCSAYYSQSQPLLKTVNEKYQVVLCTNNDECEDQRQKLKAHRSYTCENDVCCSRKVEEEAQICELSGEPVSNVECGSCTKDQYCGKKGCCDIKAWCMGIPGMLPQYTARDTKITFRDCDNNAICNKFPDSYCSKLSGKLINAVNKYCCPIPLSKTFKLENRDLLPTKLLELQTKGGDVADKLAELANQDAGFNLPTCETNKDCGKDEFCDEAVRSIPNAKLLKKNPKLCFPSPRCAGRAKKDPDGLGIKICKDPKEDCGEDSFCDTETNRGTTSPGLTNIGICCRYGCEKEAVKSGMMAGSNLDAFAVLTAQKGQCRENLDCGDPGLCIKATDQSEANYEGFPLGKEISLCCKFPMKSKEAIYQCKAGGEAQVGKGGKTMTCENDAGCNEVEGQSLADSSKWDYECIKEKAVTYCCKVHKCGDDFTYMRDELECSDPGDCMKEQEDQSDAEARAVCTPYIEKNVEKKKRCCPVGDANKRKPYCTRRRCKGMGDCQVGAYCHPTGNVCCYIGMTKIDGAAHEKGGTCQGACDDREVFGRTVPQYCVRTSDTNTGECFLSPYLKINERSRTVNPMYKTIFITSVIFTFVFPILAVIIYVNHRSKNFCDKSTPKRKKKGGGTIGGTTGGTSGV